VISVQQQLKMLIKFVEELTELFYVTQTWLEKIGINKEVSHPARITCDNIT